LEFFKRAGELLDYKTPENIFLIEPWIPKESTVLIHGVPSLGKTPLMWQMAQAIQTGGKFLGKQAEQGNALVVEFDMPLITVKYRWEKAEPKFDPDFGMFMWKTCIDSLQLVSRTADNRHKELRKMFQEYNKEFDPVFVGVDALRQVVAGNLNDEGAVHIYNAWHMTFPKATVAFVHHENKDKNPFVKLPGQQKAKGSYEWVDIAQVALRLEGGAKGTRLEITKSHVSELGHVPLNMKPGGVYFK